MFLNLLNFKLFRIPKNSAIIIFQGGIGNQIFQYFLGIELKKNIIKMFFIMILDVVIKISIVQI